MTEHPDDNPFESDPEIRDPFDQVSDESADQASDASASIPADPYDHLDDPAIGIGEIRPGKGERKFGLSFLRPLLKVAAAVVVVGLVISAGVYVVPRLLARSPQPTLAIEQLKRDLDSSDDKARQKARQQIICAETKPDDTESLKALQRIISERIKKAGPEATPEDQATDLFLRLKLESLGVTDEPAPAPLNTGAQVAPVPLDVSPTSAMSPVAIPLPYSILLAAVLGQVEPDDPHAGQINKALEQLQRSQTEEDRFAYHLYLADLYRKSKNVVQAIDHIERAEAIARSRPKIDRGPVHVLRMKILDDSLKVVHVSSAETATAIGNVDERLQDLTKKNGRLDKVETAASGAAKGLEELTKKDGRLDRVESATADVGKGLADLTKKEGRLDKVEAAASDAGKGLQELTKKDGRLEKVETATADVGKGLADLTKKEGRLDKVEAAASDAGKGLQELTKKDGRLDRMANSLASLANLEDGAEKIDEALRRAIYLILETDTLTYRLGHCKPLNDRVAGELKKATAFVAERDVTYRNDLPKLKGEKLREDYRELRRIDMNLSTWETATLVREGIQSEKDDPKGLLADLRKLDGIEKIPTDVIGREEVQSMIDEIPRGPGNGGGVTPVTVDARIKKSETALKAVINGVEAALNGRIKTVEESLAGKIGAADAKAIVESRIKTSETALKAIIDGVAASLNGRIKSVEDGLAGKISAAEAKAIVETRATKSEETYVLNLAAAEKRLNDKLVALAAAQKELDEKIKQPRPLPQDQLADLHQHTRKLVEDELARRGVQPVTLPKCELPKGPTPAPDQKRALYQFNQGCVYFYSQSKDQMPAAIKCFAEATRLDPNDPSYRYFLGCSLYCEERAVEGLEQVRCAAELEKRRDAGAEVGLRLERIQYGTRQWLERCRQSVLLGF